jgi:hypothetical protein
MDHAFEAARAAVLAAIAVAGERESRALLERDWPAPE